MSLETPAVEPACVRCGGSGWERVEPAGSVRSCDCRRAARVERLREEARIPRRYADCTLESYETSKDKPSLGAAKRTMLEFAKRYPDIEFGLLVLGPCGVGKTHLAVGLLRKLIEDRHAVGLFYDFRDLLREIQLSWDAVSQTSELQILRPVLEAEVLVLDDLGANKPTSWVQDTMAYIINNRYNEKRLTIFTSNYLDAPSRPGEETLADRIETRLRSRLHEMCKAIEIQGEDFRHKILQANYRSDHR
jgi:DNA replication protein DnaC